MIRRAFCKAFGHRPVFTHITLPRRWVCRDCGQVFGPENVETP